MVELQPAEKLPRKNSPSRRDISLPKKNHLEDESSLTDSETVFTLTSLSNDVTAIENSSTPAKSDSNNERCFLSAVRGCSQGNLRRSDASCGEAEKRGR